MEKSTSFPLEHKKKLSEILIFGNTMDALLRGNPQGNTPPLPTSHPLSLAYKTVLPQLLAAKQPMVDLGRKKENEIELIQEKHASSIKESMFSNKKNETAVEYEYKKHEVVKRNWYGKVISRTIVNPRELKRKEIAACEAKYNKEGQDMLNNEIVIVPCYVAAKDIPNDKILPTQMIPALKGFIIIPEWDANGIIRDLKR